MKPKQNKAKQDRNKYNKKGGATVKVTSQKCDKERGGNMRGPKENKRYSMENKENGEETKLSKETMF